MVDEVVELFRPIPPGWIVDATYGGGGHTRALLDAMPDRRVLAIDRDPDAIRRAPDDPRLRLRIASFGDLDRVLTEEGLVPDERPDGDSDGHHVAGVLFDLGVSSHQLDEAARGFSYHRAGPLDMRMGPDADLDAAHIVNEWSAAELRDIFIRFGEERFARRIADAIVAHRPIQDTTHLAEVVASAVPAPARRKRHPARRVFQAIRMAVNQELLELERGLEAAIRWVCPRGRIIVISYHSLEDRVVKRRFAAGAAGCECPPDLPVCACGRVAELRPLARKALKPSAEEVERNPRARSARLRAVEKLFTFPTPGNDDPSGLDETGPFHGDAA